MHLAFVLLVAMLSSAGVSSAVSSGGTAASARQIFDMWPGFWRIKRSVVSPVKSENMQASGLAAFVPSGEHSNVIRYSEKVVLNEQGGVGTQRYLYKLDATSSSISKHFSDGRLFYNMSLAGSRVHADAHLCVADTYMPEYMFIDAATFRLVYAVTGPAKAYTITTDFVKLSPEEVTQAGLTLTVDGELV